MSTTSYLKNFFSDKLVASVTPSSHYTSRRLCRKIDFDKADVIVEYGPGTGILSKAFLSNMNDKTRLLLVETNPKFVEALQQMQEPQIEVVQNDALQIREILKQKGIDQADYIISGVPLSFLTKDQRYQMIKDAYDVLKPGGKLIIYQFSRTAKDYILTYFEHVSNEFEFFNIPPLTIYEAVK